jgi:ATP-grasp domain/L-amino acid ligase C-terminal domain 2/ATP-grasp N-terminal domain
MPRILLFASTTGYQVHSFAEAAGRLGFELILATDRCHVLDDPWGDRATAVRFDGSVQFDNPTAGFEALRARSPFDGVLAVGDQPALVAAQAAESLGLEFSPPAAVIAANNKFLSRERFANAGLLTPGYRLLSQPIDSQSIRYPCVLKPLGLSGSRGVIRADDAAQFAAAFARIQKLNALDRSIQVEDFIPGREFALEGVVTRGELQTLALFDKPDPLDGPFFEETIYVTPSRQSEGVRRAIQETTQRAVRALGLTSGPVHAEMRVNDRGVWMLEVAARPIGGLCSRVLRLETGTDHEEALHAVADQEQALHTVAPLLHPRLRETVTLEEILLRHAAGENVGDARLAAGGHAVMMIPIPRAGVYVGTRGVEQARAVGHGAEHTDVIITAKPGQTMLPLPEGASYLGFIFGHADSPEAAERAVREAHARLHFEFSTPLPVVR